MAIAVDLDGTLAEYHGWKGEEHIGKAIKPMMERVKKWIAEGEEVVIFTARGGDPVEKHYVDLWLKQHGLDLEVTNIKRKSFKVFYDDRAKQVIPNTGIVVESHAQMGVS